MASDEREVLSARASEVVHSDHRGHVDVREHLLGAFVVKPESGGEHDQHAEQPREAVQHATPAPRALVELVKTPDALRDVAAMPI